MENTPVVVERVLDAPSHKVWQALTDNTQMKQWYFQLQEFRPEVGFEFRFLAGPPDKEYLHICTITDVIPEKKLAYTWRYEGIPGQSHVSFDLTPEGDKTKVTITHTGLETFVTDDPNFRRESFNQGWNHILGISLKDFVEAA